MKFMTKLLFLLTAILIPSKPASSYAFRPGCNAKCSPKKCEANFELTAYCLNNCASKGANTCLDVAKKQMNEELKEISSANTQSKQQMELNKRDKCNNAYKIFYQVCNGNKTFTEEQFKEALDNCTIHTIAGKKNLNFFQTFNGIYLALKDPQKDQKLCNNLAGIVRGRLHNPSYWINLQNAID